MEGNGYRISARSLANHGYVKIHGRGHTWRAELTELGRAFLAREETGGPAAPPEIVPSERPVPVPSDTKRLNPLARRFRDDTERHEVSRASLDRAVRIVQAIVVEARRRGYLIRTARPRRDNHNFNAKNPHLVIAVGDHEYTLRVYEQGVEIRGHFESGDWPYHYPPLPAYDSNGTGRLSLVLRGSLVDIRWVDAEGKALETRLQRLFAKLDALAAEDRTREPQRRLRNERDELLAERLAAGAVAEKLAADVPAWRRCQLQREYVAAVEERYGFLPDVADWIRLARRCIEESDPLRLPPTLL